MWLQDVSSWDTPCPPNRVPGGRGPPGPPLVPPTCYGRLGRERGLGLWGLQKFPDVSSPSSLSQSLSDWCAAAVMARAAFNPVFGGTTATIAGGEVALRALGCTMELPGLKSSIVVV